MTIGNMSAATHPIWGIARLLIVMTALTVTLAVSASTFDQTELQTILIMFAVYAGTEGATGYLRSFARSRDSQDTHNG